MNKLLADFNTQYNAYPFRDISNADIEEAINCGIAEEKKSIETICACNDQPTFENTILAFEASGETLSRATTLLYNLLSANRNDELENIAEKITPILTAHQSEIYQNEELFARVDYVKQNEKMASSEDQMLLDKIYEAFVNSGIALCKGKRQRFNQIKEELAQLKLQFSKNLVNETKEFRLLITDERDISGLPKINAQQAAEKAIDNGTTGWWFDLYAPSYIPFMSYIKNRNLRKEMYMAYNTRCSKAQNNNAEICKTIVNLKRELAQILGYKSYAEYVLKNRMAERVENVDAFLDNLKKSYLPFAQKEVQEIIDKEIKGK